MDIYAWFQSLRKWFALCFLSFILLIGLTSQAFSQTASPINQLCRQVNTKSAPGPIAFYAPGGSPIQASGNRDDGPGSGEAVYLTNSPAELSVDRRYTRVWFKSLDPNYKLGWIATKMSDGDDMLKMGSNRWRANTCVE